MHHFPTCFRIANTISYKLHVALLQEMAPLPQQPKAEPKTLPRELSFPRTSELLLSFPTICHLHFHLLTTNTSSPRSFLLSASLHKTLSIQNLTQIETPWENVTLNRCLFVAITILVLTSGVQRLNGK